MAKSKLLIVDDALDIQKLLDITFTAQGYEVHTAGRGGEGLARCRELRPDLILLDINLPDMDGYDVCRSLRSNLRTSHIPIIFLTERDEKSSKIAGLELGADDYVTKPFDIQELSLRVKRGVERARYENLTNPTTGMPGTRLIEDRLRQLLRSENWAVLYIGINNMRAFNDIYGFFAGDDALRLTGKIITETVDRLGTADDFIGHLAGAEFVVVTTPDKVVTIGREIIVEFDKVIPSFYSYEDRKSGYMSWLDENGQARQMPLMSLSIGIVTDEQYAFTDVREITEAAAEARQHSRQLPGSALHIVQ